MSLELRSIAGGTTLDRTRAAIVRFSRDYVAAKLKQRRKQIYLFIIIITIIIIIFFRKFKHRTKIKQN